MNLISHNSRLAVLVVLLTGLLPLVQVPSVMAEVPMTQRAQKPLPAVLERLSKLRYLILPVTGLGGSSVPSTFIPVTWRGAKLPEGCLSAVNRLRVRRGLEPMFEEFQLSSESPPVSTFIQPGFRPLTLGEERLAAGICKKFKVSVTRRFARLRNGFIPNEGPVTFEQSFCPPGARCKVPRAALELVYQQNVGTLLGDEETQSLSLREQRVQGVKVTKAELSLVRNFETGSPSVTKNFAGSYCGIACRNRADCLAQMAALGEGGLAKLCENAPPRGDPTERYCINTSGIPGLSGPAACSVLAGVLEAQVQSIEPRSVGTPYTELLSDKLNRSTCCFAISSCQELWQPAFDCGPLDGAPNECAAARGLLSVAFSQIVPACVSYRPDGL